MAGWEFDLLLGLEAIGAEDAFDFGDFGEVGGVAGSAELGRPVLRVLKFFAPAREVKLDVDLPMAVLQGVDGLVGAVGGSARILVKMGLFDDSGDGGCLFDIEQGGAVLAGGLDVFAPEMITPKVAGDAHGLMDAAGVMRLQMLHQLRDAPLA